MQMHVLDKDKLRSHREKRGLTPAELAERIGISEGHLRRFELGVRQPSVQTYAALIDALDLKEGALLNKKPAKPQT